MNVFLTGGTGLIGSVILNKFYGKSYAISATYRKIKDENLPIRWIKLDALDCTEEQVVEMTKNQDVIVHNAASLKLGVSDEEIKELQKVNINFTKKLLIAASKNNIKKFIFISTLSGTKKPLPDIITEKSELDPTTFYAKSKIEGEQLIQEYAAKSGFNYYIYRISSPVSELKYLPDTVLRKWIRLSIDNQPIIVFGNGNRRQDFVAVSDVANVVISGIEKENISGIYNIASGSSMSMMEVAELIAAKFKTTIQKCGIDINENDKWNVSIEKAKNELSYHPEYSSKQVILNLLQNIVV